MKKKILSIVLIAVILVSVLSSFAFAADTASPYFDKLKAHVIENGIVDSDSGAFAIPIYTEPAGLVIMVMYMPSQDALALSTVAVNEGKSIVYALVFDEEFSGLYQWAYLETEDGESANIAIGYTNKQQTKDTPLSVFMYDGDEQQKLSVLSKAKTLHNVNMVALASYLEQNELGHFSDYGFNPDYFCTNGHTFGEFTYNNDATHAKDGTKSRLCSECLYLETVTAEGTKRLDLPHTLKKMNDHNTHWVGCDCGYKEDEAEHDYVGNCDSTCDTCGYRRGYISPHLYDQLKSNDKTHWQQCACGQIAGDEYHIYDHGFDVDCSFCGYVRVAPNTGSKEFADVSKSAWYKYYVDYAVAYGLYKGTDDNHFSPNGEMTRAQFVQVLANLSGMTLNNNAASGFSDVPSGKWFTGAVTWAVKKGIAKGVGSGKFDPNGKIDRQQMCTMLVNYVENYKNTTLNKKVTYKPFADDKDIAAWAKSGVIKCFEAGLVTGTGNNKFSPKVVANRATGATIFTNFHKEYIK